MNGFTLTFADQTLCLLPDRAIHWPARNALLVADVHLAKGAAFRSAGVPVPAGNSAKDLSRISTLITETKAQRLIILGDLFHARAGLQLEVLDTVARWRRQHPDLHITLIRGNHDRACGPLPKDWRIDDVGERLVEDGICLTHEPPCEPARPTLCGHIHPIHWLRDYDGTSVRVACFAFDDGCGILPAFGTFTGGCALEPASGRRVYLCLPGKVIALSTPPKRRV